MLPASAGHAWLTPVAWVWWPPRPLAKAHSHADNTVVVGVSPQLAVTAAPGHHLLIVYAFSCQL